MKIAAFYSDNPFAGWIQAGGFAETLGRMGHEVVPIPVPSRGFGRTDGGRITKEAAAKINKPIDDCDLVIVSGPEWLRKWIELFYPEWSKLKCPKAGWYHESFVRDDFTLDYSHYEAMFDFHFFPDPRDAEKYKGEFLPLGVDCDMFHSGPESERDIPVGFIGLMYQKRAEFLDSVKPHLGDITIQCRSAFESAQGIVPAIGVWDFDGFNVRKSMLALAEAYRRIKVFVTFPSMSKVVVAKVLESMRSGCCLVAPKQPIELENYFPYDGSYQCAEQIKKALASTGVGEAASVETRKHSMAARFELIFEKAGILCPTF